MKDNNISKINYKDKFSLDNKVIVITGGCGLIGRSFVEACRQFNASVVIVDIPQARPEEFAREISNSTKSNIIGLEADVASRESVTKLRDIIINKFGKIDGLVNCHQNKTAKFFAKFEEYKDEDWDAVVETNLKGTYLTCQILGGWMAKKKKGCIINIPSTYSVVAPNQNLYKGTNLGCPAAYSASKGGVMAFSQYLASYWASSGVRVNQITPHGVLNNHEEKFKENFSNFSPLQRMCEDHEVASALIYLLSDASSYVTGHNLIVDGGWTMW